MKGAPLRGGIPPDILGSFLHTQFRAAKSCLLPPRLHQPRASKTSPSADQGISGGQNC